MKPQPTPKFACCSTRQKVWGLAALGGLFVCGLMIGIAVNGGGVEKRHVKEIGMTERQCNEIADEITDVARCSAESCATRLRELNEVYTKNCAGRTFEVEAPKPAPKVEDAADKKTCEVIEELLSERLNNGDYTRIATHSDNIAVYKRMVEKGCPENADKYNELIARESAIIDALKSGTSSDNTQTCAEIEKLLLQQVYYCDTNSECHINNAKIYANMSERGCPENSQHYVDLAARELEIARALRDDKFDNDETVEVVETYKRLEMKQAATEVIDKVQKLTDPAIDFIIQIQKIIEE